MPLVLLVPSSPWMKGEVEHRPDACHDLEAIPWHVMEVGDSVLVHADISREALSECVHAAQETHKGRFWRILRHSDCYEVGRIGPHRVSEFERSEYEAWRKRNGLDDKPAPQPPKPLLH